MRRAASTVCGSGGSMQATAETLVLEEGGWESPVGSTPAALAQRLDAAVPRVVDFGFESQWGATDG